MAKRKKGDGQQLGITATDSEIDRCVANYDLQREAVAEASEAARSALEPLAEKGLVKNAVKAALRLRKLEPTKLAAWFRSFDTMTDSLRLRAQQELPMAQPGQSPATLQ